MIASVNCLLSKACVLYNTDKCNEGCIIKKEFDFLVESSNIPIAYREDTPLYPDESDTETFETLEKIKHDIENFVKDGRFLYLHGDYGNGKSQWAIKLLKSFLAKTCIGNRFKERALFAYMPEASEKFKLFEAREEREGFLNSLLTRELVILDDFAIERASDYMNTMLNLVVNQRYSNKLATIFTSNIPLERLNHYIDERAIDRISSDLVLELKSGSSRVSTNKYERRS